MVGFRAAWSVTPAVNSSASVSRGWGGEDRADEVRRQDVRPGAADVEPRRDLQQVTLEVERRVHRGPVVAHDHVEGALPTLGGPARARRQRHGDVPAGLSYDSVALSYAGTSPRSCSTAAT